MTAEADRTARAFIRHVRPRNPGARIVVTGCYAQRIAALRVLADEKARRFRCRFVDRTLSAVTLEGGDAEHTPALSANFLKVEVAGAIPANRMVVVSVFLQAENAVLAGRDIPGPPLQSSASKQTEARYTE